jgi:hypothetical protein
MYLKKVTLILIFSMIASFSVRIFGTLFPSIFYNIVIVKAFILINAFFILSHLLFWLVFYQEYISANKPALKKPCLLAIAGSLAVSVLYLKKLPLVFDASMNFTPILASPYFDAITPFIGAVFHLVFFVFFKNSLSPEEMSSLKSPVISIITGICIYICLHLIVLVNFLTTEKFEWLEHMPREVAVITMPVMAFSACLMLFFYYRFYQAVENLLRLTIKH